MIYTNSSLIPLNIVLPVIFKVIPLKGDLDEEKVIIKMILNLFDSSKKFFNDECKFFKIIDLAALNSFENASIGVLIDGLINRPKYKLPEELANASIIVLKKLMEDANCRKLIEVIHYYSNL